MISRFGRASILSELWTVSLLIQELLQLFEFQSTSVSLSINVTLFVYKSSLNPKKIYLKKDSANSAREQT